MNPKYIALTKWYPPKKKWSLYVFRDSEMIHAIDTEFFSKKDEAHNRAREILISVGLTDDELNNLVLYK